MSNSVQPSHSAPIANIRIAASAQRVEDWFRSLSAHPEAYRFASHGGFVFTKGSFGEVGAQFQTREWFFGIPLTIRFTLANIEDNAFTCQVRAPFRGSWCRFSMTPLSASETRLTLETGTENAWKRATLRIPLVYRAIQNQIQSEVEHIKQAIETLATE